ncbi:MAG TPA: fibronectin type III domain-containing protein [bacterium]|nr:fibronectin type III domain-containing protein [bacterium]
MKKTILLLLLIAAATSGQIPHPIGWWKFDDPASLTRAEAGFGRDLEAVGNAVTAVFGPDSGNGAVRIGTGSYFKLDHDIPGNGDGIYLNEYTLAFDFRVPALGVWYCFFQTNTANSNDGECFINPYGNVGVGATGYSGASIKPGEWYRLILSVKNGSFFQFYLDGVPSFSGATQIRDGRFSIENPLLLFADENGEDGAIDCAEVAIWDRPLTAVEVKLLGGFGHTFHYDLMTRVPYLQAPTPTSIQVCWHDSSAVPSRVEYGLSPALGESAAASQEQLSGPYRWHAAKLAGLQPDTEYFYRVVSGDGASPLCTFRTLPEPAKAGKLRMLLLSDTHSGDSTMVNRVVRAARAKIGALYGEDLHNQLNLVFHSGDLVVSGGVINQYTDQYFRPMAQLSSSVPFMTVTGNHEGESPYYYQYMKYDDHSLLAPPSAYAERMWELKAGNTLFIGLNTNIVSAAGALQKALLDGRLQKAEQDPAIDFVFIFFHHLPWSELWVEGVTNDAGSNFIRRELFPVIRKYTKVQQLTYGHTHAFERGTVESPMPDGDFRIVCAGGGGGATDNWGEFQNIDHPFIHVAYDHYFFQILEIDVPNHSFEISMYSLGNQFKSREAQLMDRWYRKVSQHGPDTPVIETPIMQESALVLKSSPFSGPDSLMSVQIQIAEGAEFSSPKIDTLVHWRNIYGVDANYEPVDKNAGIDLTRTAFSRARFQTGKSYACRVRYRDHNLKWSGWSNATSFNVEASVGLGDESPGRYELAQNYPNPFNGSTIIAYQIPNPAHVSLKLYNLLGQDVRTLVDTQMAAGMHRVELDSRGLPSGLYIYELACDAFLVRKRLNLAK